MWQKIERNKKIDCYILKEQPKYERNGSNLKCHNKLQNDQMIFYKKRDMGGHKSAIVLFKCNLIPIIQ